MFSRLFGIEVEFTGITRACAAMVVAEFIGGSIRESGRNYSVTAADGRVWQIVYDGSIIPKKKDNGRTVSASDDYKVELVSPILTYREDIETVQKLVRRLRKAGALADPNTSGIHIHLNGADHTPRSIRNFINIIASRNDLLYKALQIKPDRMDYCKKMDEYLVERMNKYRPQTFDQIKKIWYEGYSGSQSSKYHRSRYHFCNLHSFFNGVGTVELRGFNSELHAGKIRSYILLALAINNQALIQKSASARKPQVENEKFSMRVYLNRIGFIGKEFKNCREHLCRHLSGNSAWRYRVGA